MKLQRKYDQDLTEGNIIRQIVAFTLPLLLGNVFQQMYNTVDTWVLGNFASNEEFSAVGTVAPVVNMLLGAVIGLSGGAGVVVSQYYGAKQYERTNQTVCTSMLMTLALSALLTVLGITLTPLLLRAMRIPDVVYDSARDYLVIFFSGSVGMMYYNIASGIMRALGDSRRPFLYLVCCTILNTILDLVFVVYFKAGVRGVAIATILAQLISAILSVGTLMLPGAQIRIMFGRQYLSAHVLRQILIIGFPAALQMGITSFSNVFVQAYINYFGPDAMSGWTVFNKIDSFVMLPIASLALTATTFVGQNIGSGSPLRAKKGVTASFLLSLATTAVFGAAVIAFAPQMVTFFNPKPEVVEIGTRLVRWFTPFYVMPCVIYIYSGAMRGAGHSTAPLIVTMISFVAFRQIYMFVISQLRNTFMLIGFGYPAGWFVCAVLMLIVYKRIDFGSKAVTQQRAL